MKTFKMPDLGEGLQEAEIVAWHVAVGDKVVADQPLASVETDKAVVEIPAPFTASIAELFAEPGSIVAVGAPLVGLDDAADDADNGAVVGRLPTADEREAPDAAVTRSRRSDERVKATPTVRALARRLDVDLANVDPTGADGQVTADDVRRAADVLSGLEPAEPLRGVRRAMATRMARAHREVVPASVWDEADIGDWPDGADVTVRLVEALAAGVRALPLLNAWYESESESLRVLGRIDVGIAVDTPDGLLVPVLRDVGGRERSDLRNGLERLKQDAMARRIPPEELRGATISLSNFGVLGAGRFAALVVVPPQVAIIGAGGSRETVVLREGKPVARRMLPISLTFDHRIVTGGEAAQFLAAMLADLARAD